MNPNIHFLIRTPMLATLAMLVPAAPILAATPISETVAPIAADGSLVISNPRGRIEVTAWDRNEVSWSGSLGQGAKLEVEKSPTRVALRIESEGASRWIGWRDQPSEDSALLVKVPASLSLDLSAVSANIDVSGMRSSASIEAESVSGDVSVHATGIGKIEVSSVSGDVLVEGDADRIEVDTISGDLKLLSGGSDKTAIETVSGSVVAKESTVAEFEAASVSGDIEFEGGLAAQARVEIESTSGDIRVSLPADASAQVAVHSFSGRIDNDFDLPVEKAVGGGSTLRGALGGGNARVEIDSFSGDVILRKR